MNDRAEIPELTSADLFAGAGGLSVGFHEAGFETLFFNEMDEKAGATFGRNFPSATPFIGPVEELSAGRIREESALGGGGDLDVMVGGPPCQGFSINAPMRSGSDARNHLFRHFIRIVLEGVRPKFVVIENVPGLVSLGSGETLRSVAAAFEGTGYRVAFRILNAAHYGAPQERWRLFFIGTRLPDVKLSFPEPTRFSFQRPNFTGGREHIFRHAVGGFQDGLFGEPLTAPTTVGEAIGDLPPIPSGGGEAEMEYAREAEGAYQAGMRSGSKGIFNHECAGVSEVNLERMKHVHPGGSWRDIPFELLPKGMQRARRSDHTRRYGRLHPDRLSPTIMTKCDPHWGTVFHYGRDRIISVREAARIQSFPDWFRFTGSKADQYRQAGNAVPPILAKALAEHIKGLLETADGHRPKGRKEAHSILTHTSPPRKPGRDPHPHPQPRHTNPRDRLR